MPSRPVTNHLAVLSICVTLNLLFGCSNPCESRRRTHVNDGGSFRIKEITYPGIHAPRLISAKGQKIDFYAYNADWYFLVPVIGDSIHKEKGNEIYQLIKQDTTTLLSFECDGYYTTTTVKRWKNGDSLNAKTVFHYTNR